MQKTQIRSGKLLGIIKLRFIPTVVEKKERETLQYEEWGLVLSWMLSWMLS